MIVSTDHGPAQGFYIARRKWSRVMTDFEIILTAHTYGGDVMGRLPDGKAIFIPYGLPGERVLVRVLEEKRGHAKGELVEIIEPSAERITPRCPHFTTCGGCHYQHFSYAKQLEVKTAIVRDLLERIGGVKSPPVKSIIPSPQEWNYRNHAQFHLTSEGKLGYQAANTHHVIPIQECHILEPLLDEIWRLLDVDAIPGLKRVSLRVGAGEEVLLLLESDDPLPPEFNVDIPLSAVHVGTDGPSVLAGNDYLTMEVLGRAFTVSAESFFQVNILQAANMAQHLLEILPLKANTCVMDLYCGVGLFSAFMAERVEQVIGVEVAPTACTDFAVNLDEFDNVELYEGAVEKVLPGLKVRPDIILIDPPRTGIDRSALDTILSLKPGTIAYVSCDPATLSRDVQRFITGGYHLEQITPFDLFPQTYHIETVCLMSKVKK